MFDEELKVANESELTPALEKEILSAVAEG